MRALLVLLLSWPVLAQPLPLPPSFEVATVKVSPPIGGTNTMVGMQIDPGRVRYANLGLKALIIMAYGVAADQILGVPIEFRYPLAYEIVATTPSNATKEQIARMLQSLLAERFKLAAHRETRDSSIYALTVAKNGPKLKTSQADTMTINARQRGHFEARKVTLELLATDFQGLGFTDRPVLDRTELKGDYDVVLDWAPDDIKSDDLSSRPSLFTAVQEQLGLKLEPAKAPREFLVVDHVEKPSEN